MSAFENCLLEFPSLRLMGRSIKVGEEIDLWLCLYVGIHVLEQSKETPPTVRYCFDAVLIG